MGEVYQHAGHYPSPPTLRFTLKGHQAKITSLSCSPSDPHIVSIATNSFLLVWYLPSAHKARIALHTSSTLTCSLSPSNQFVAYGGLDNLCSMRSIQRPLSRVSLEGHLGYTTHVLYTSNESIVSSSADCTCIHWDIESAKQKSTFLGHSAEVMSFSVCLGSNLLVSGSCDKTSRMYDLSEGTHIYTFEGHQSDINCV
uniref:Uncharacterized protein n=1 Tax=Arcella intermedia TaxID=1963864 RepID=A0A6B2LGW4_9EUKA